MQNNRICQFYKLLIAVSFLSLLSVPVHANSVKELAGNSLFKVTASGKLLEGEGSGDDYNRQGTAFAISSSTLVTAMHVVGDKTKLRNILRNGGMLHIPNQFVSLTGTKDGQNYLVSKDKVFITESLNQTVDAVLLNAPEQTFSPISQEINACGIDMDTEYWTLILLNGDINSPTKVDLVPVDRTSKYRDMYLFSNEDYLLSSKKIKEGNSGSPVFDGSGRLVGLLSAVGQNDEKVYVTLISTFIDLFPDSVVANCDPRVTKRQIALLVKEIKELREEVNFLTAKLGISEEYTKDPVHDRLHSVETEMGDVRKFFNWKCEFESDGTGLIKFKKASKGDEKSNLKEVVINLLATETKNVLNANDEEVPATGKGPNIETHRKLVENTNPLRGNIALPNLKDVARKRLQLDPTVTDVHELIAEYVPILSSGTQLQREQCRFRFAETVSRESQ